jgi:hypothetical protein
VVIPPICVAVSPSCQSGHEERTLSKLNGLGAREDALGVQPSDREENHHL